MDKSGMLVFIDSAYVTGAAHNLKSKRKVDWENLLNHFKEDSNRKLIEAVVYVGLPPTSKNWEEPRMRTEGFVHYLREKGFLVVTKDGSPTGKDQQYKSNIEVLMAIDAIELSIEVHPDIVVLITGDADFAQVAYKLRRRGIRVEVAALKDQLGKELRLAANESVHFLDGLLENSEEIP